MNDRILAEKMIETLYMLISDNITDDVCETCPVVRAVRDMKDTMKEGNHEQIITELGLVFGSAACPCDKRIRP